MTYKEVVTKFLDKVDYIKRMKPSYRQPGDGSDGTCDCIGLIIGAIRRIGLKWTGIHGSNWAARKEFVKLEKISSLSDLKLGDAVLKAYDKGHSKWDLPPRYQKGGKYYNGDLKDYYHAGVVTSLNPIVITHMTSPTVKTLTVKSMKDLGNWNHHGVLKILNNAAGGSIPEPVDPTTPTRGATAVVVAQSGSTVNLRKAASMNSSILVRVPLGTQVDIIEPGENWAKIKYKTYFGYMMAKFLDIVGDGKGDH